MPKFETTLAHEGEITTITTNDPEVHAAVNNIDSAKLIDDADDRKEFQLPRAEARIHFPHLIGNE